MGQEQKIDVRSRCSGGQKPLCDSGSTVDQDTCPIAGTYECGGAISTGVDGWASCTEKVKLHLRVMLSRQRL